MFEFVKSIDGSAPQYISMTAASGTYAVGMALKFASGKLTKATGSDVVEYVCAQNATLTADGTITVFAVSPGMLFEAPLQAYSSTYHVAGLRAQIYTDGLQLANSAATTLYGSTATGSYTSGTAVPTLGGAYIVNTMGASAAGDKVLVRLNYAH